MQSKEFDTLHRFGVSVVYFIVEKQIDHMGGPVSVQNRKLNVSEWK